MPPRRYQQHRRRQRPRSPWAALLIPFLAILITGAAFYFLADMLGTQIVPTPTALAMVPSPTAINPATPTPDATPTPEPTATAIPPTPTPSPAPNVLQVGVEATVNAEAGLRVRGGPGTSFESVTMLPLGTIVLVVDGPQRADTYTWWQIRFTGEDGQQQDGWVAGVFLDPGAG